MSGHFTLHPVLLVLWPVVLQNKMVVGLTQLRGDFYIALCDVWAGTSFNLECLENVCILLFIFCNHRYKPYSIQGRSPAFGPCPFFMRTSRVGVCVCVSNETAVDLIHMCLQKIMATSLPLLFIYTFVGILTIWFINNIVG